MSQSSGHFCKHFAIRAQLRYCERMLYVKTLDAWMQCADKVFEMHCELALEPWPCLSCNHCFLVSDDVIAQRGVEASLQWSMSRLPELNERQSRSRSPRREDPTNTSALDPLPEDTEELLRDLVMWPGSSH